MLNLSTHWEIDKIIEVANNLIHGTNSGASTGERIAAAFVLNDMDWLPESHQDIIQAWDSLGDNWQGYVRLIKRDYQHRLLPY
jgi:hypothetical protein